MEKMKAIKILLKNWNKEVFGRVEENKRSALAKVAVWDNLESERPLSPEELGTRMTALEEFKKWSLMEETSWRQKSREIWLKEGDRNTGFFHRMANSHKKSNTIEMIRIGGEWLEGDGEVRTGIVNAFKTLLSDPGFWRASPEGLDFSRLEVSAASKLEEPFTEAEIHAALLNLNGDKAPGPDGFTAAFWQHSWDFVKPDILALFKDFHERGRFGKGLNSTFLVLIPKIRGAEDLKDFRPISLISSIYKLIAKVLANRLKKVMNGLVNPAQNAFVEGRQILDASLIANEVIDSMQKRKESGILCKLDIEKAYDQINWNFILKVLKKMGFGDKWVSWIEWCISTATFSVMINGSPAGFFGSSRGLRQGDPLSPYLFVLGMEALSLMIDKAAEGGFISGYMFKGRDNTVKKITHLLFADDTLVFCKDTEDQMTHLCWILAWFEALSGLKINLEKSSLLPVGRVEDVDGLAAELGCKKGSLPTEYLGLPLGAKHKEARVWDGVEERFRNRLALWKRQYISKGGRLTLIRSVLSNMPTYLLSLFRIPKKVKLRLEKIQRDFLWGGGSSERKIHLLNWDSVCQSKEKGGLGIRNFTNFNRALLGKWCWRFSTEDKSMWRSVIMLKYGAEDGGCFPSNPKGCHGVGLWKEICKEALFLRNHCSVKIGDGSKVRFWEDWWCGEAPLCSSFPSLYRLANSKGAKVAEFWVASGSGEGWNFSFGRHFQDWELEEVQNFLATVNPQSINPNITDRLWWNKEKNGCFSVKTCFELLEGGSQQSVPLKMMWNPTVPTKVGFFAWEVWWGKTLTMDQLKKRGFSLASRCAFCGQDEESLEHLFIHCPKVWCIWTAIFSLSGGGWVCPFLVKDLLRGWLHLPMQKKDAKLWRAVPLCLLWAIWKERNRVVFDDEAFSKSRLKSSFLFSFSSWASLMIEVDHPFVRDIFNIP